MSYPIVESFKGYNAKVDRKLNDPSIGSNCNNVMIHQGNLCNIPMLDSEDILDKESLAALYFYSITSGETDKTVTGIILFNTNGEVWVKNTYVDSGRQDFTRIEIPDFGDVLRPKFPFNDTRLYNASQVTGISGNIVQVNDWLFFLCQTGPQIPSSVSEDVPIVYPQMFRVRFPGRTPVTTNQYNYIKSLVGLQQPPEVSLLSNTSISNGVTGALLDFGFSFAWEQYDFNSTSIGTPSILESNVTIYDLPTTYSSRKLTFKVYLPAGYITLFNVSGMGGVQYVYVYLKQQSQSVYYYWQKINIGSLSIKVDGQKRYVEIILDTVIAQDQTVQAPLTSVTPIPGAHDVPKLATHGAFYKGKMYYNCLEFKNLLQVSAVTPLTQVDTGQYANYIEHHVFIGKSTEPINGIVEFLGQLILLKEASTYVVTDYIPLGEIRPLFHDIGCVKGGKAYIVVDNKLYFGSFKGIYFYDGSGPSPIKISDPIQKDLEKISKTRYAYMRISHDPQHQLIYVSFPLGFGCPASEVVPTFIFHYNEGGVWTKQDQVSDVLVDTQNNQGGLQVQPFSILYNRPDKIHSIKSMDQAVDLINAIEWFWQSSVIDFGQAEKLKEFLWTKLETIPELSDDLKITTEFFDGLNNPLVGGSQGIVDLPKKKLRKINAHKKALMIKVSGTTRVPFRITGLDLEAFVAGVM